MKIFNLSRNLLIPIIGALLFVGCADNEQGYVNISDSQITFDFARNENVVIKVTSSPDAWSIESKSDWIVIVEQTTETLTINVEDSEVMAPRDGDIVITAGGVSKSIGVHQMAGDGTFYRYDLMMEFASDVRISPNGRYVAGFTNHILPDDSWAFVPIIIDASTRERFVFPTYSENDMSLEFACAVTEKGQFFVRPGSGENLLMFDINDLTGYQTVALPSESMYSGVTMSNSSGDGTIWVGYANDQKSDDFGLKPFVPIVWENGEPKILSYPETDFRGNEKIARGVLVRGISNDGSVIYGSTLIDDDRHMLIWDDWRNPEAKPYFAGRTNVREIEMINGMGLPYIRTFVDGITISAEVYNISPNGKYVAGTFRREIVEDGKMLLGLAPVFFNTETKETYVFPREIIIDRYQPGDMAATCTDDGIGFILNGSSGRVVDIESGAELGSNVKWLENNYNISSSSGFIEYISPDKEVVFGAKLVPQAPASIWRYWFVRPQD